MHVSLRIYLVSTYLMIVNRDALDRMFVKKYHIVWFMNGAIDLQIEQIVSCWRTKKITLAYLSPLKHSYFVRIISRARVNDIVFSELPYISIKGKHSDRSFARCFKIVNFRWHVGTDIHRAISMTTLVYTHNKIDKCRTDSSWRSNASNIFLPWINSVFCHHFLGLKTH